MEYELPTEFDLIVVGTGVVESIVAAAASRIGKRVLHIDSNNYYGGAWASFNLDTVNKLQSELEPSSDQSQNDAEQQLQQSEKLYPVGNDLFDIFIQSQTWHVPEKAPVRVKSEDSSKVIDSTEQKVEIDNEGGTIEIPTAEKEQTEEPETWSQESLLKNSRKFNIDLAPKLHFARGDFVELLISSNIARYSEFRSVSRVLTWLNGQLEVVPCSRSDVFSSTKVSVIEKRMLMKLLTACMDEDEKEFQGYENKTFRSFLRDRKLTDNLLHYVLYAIAMGTDRMPCSEGIANTKRFLGSLGRFGKTPFLYSMYGSGEITQAFCRLSAVFGGIYALNQPLNGLIFDNEDNFKSLLCGNQRISAEHLVLGIEKLPKSLVKVKTTDLISRAVFITDRSVMYSEKEHLTLLLIPPENGKSPCTVIELGTLTGTCPKGLHIVHMFTKHKVNPKEDLNHCVEKLFKESEREGTSKDATKAIIPNILWSFYFSVPDTFQLDLRTGLPKNVFTCPGPDLDLDYDPAIRKAKTVFNEIYPDAEFLPRAPDPEEIVIEGEDNNNVITEGDNFLNEQNVMNEVIQGVANVDVESNPVENVEADSMAQGDSDNANQ